VVAHGSAGLSAGQTSLAVAAATKLEFTVGGHPASPGLFAGFPGPLAGVAAVLVLIAAVVLIIRRSGLRIRIERGRRGPDAVDHEGGPRGAF
jgi:hypothetical protein